MCSIRRYTGLMKRRLDGEYGEAGTESPAAWLKATACSGLSKIAPAPVDAAHSVNVARSAKSPTPHDPAERSEYSWTIQPQVVGDVGSGSGGSLSTTSTSSRRSTSSMTAGATLTSTPCQFSYRVATPYAAANCSRLFIA